MLFYTDFEHYSRQKSPTRMRDLRGGFLESHTSEEERYADSSLCSTHAFKGTLMLKLGMGSVEPVERFLSITDNVHCESDDFRIG
mgnify:CR=1 FL=1